VSVLYGSQSKKRLLFYTSLTDWFLKPWWKVFTARYGLIPYMKQIYGSQNKKRLLFYTSLTDWVFKAVVESVYSAVRTDSLYEADYDSSLKG